MLRGRDLQEFIRVYWFSGFAEGGPVLPAALSGARLPILQEMR